MKKKDILYTYTTISVVEETNLFYIEKEEIYKSLLDEEETSFDEVYERVVEDLGVLKLRQNDNQEIVLIQKADRFELQKPIEESYESFGKLYVCKDEDKEAVHSVINKIKNLSIDIDEDENFGDEVYIDLTHDVNNIDELMKYMMPLNINNDTREAFLSIVDGMEMSFVPKILCTNQKQCSRDNSSLSTVVASTIKVS